MKMKKKNPASPLMEGKRRGISSNAVTLLMVVVIYAVVCYLLYSGNMSRQVTNMLVSISCYIVLAVSLTWWSASWASCPWDMRASCPWVSSPAALSLATVEVLPLPVRLPVSMIVGGLAPPWWVGGRPAGTPAQGRLPGHRHAGLR